MAIKIHTINTQMIKPSTSSPQDRKYIKLSLLDQMHFAMSTPLIFFYPSNGKNHNEIREKSQFLKSSLSKALTLFYPLAGEVKDNCFIDCNDQGVEYVEAEVGCVMSEAFHQTDGELLERLIQFDLNPKGAFKGAVIQANFFVCGGLAIAISVSHKVCDAASLGKFIFAWAAACLSETTNPSSDRITEFPHFVSDSIIPSLKDQSFPPPPILETDTTPVRTLRLVFDAAKVKLLKAKAASASVQRPTRVEAVTAFTWKCLMNLSRSKSGFSRESFIAQSVNFRKRLAPPLPDNYIGNLSGKFLVGAKDSDLQELVFLMRKRLEEETEKISKGIEARDVIGLGKEFWELLTRNDVDLYSFASVCGFPFYEVDFGWGKPLWLAPTSLVLRNYAILVDSRDGKGIEVWISLSEEDGFLIQRNQEFLEFASVNPSVEEDDEEEEEVSLQSCM